MRIKLQITECVHVLMKHNKVKLYSDTSPDPSQTGDNKYWFSLFICGCFVSVIALILRDRWKLELASENPLLLFYGLRCRDNAFPCITAGKQPLKYKYKTRSSPVQSVVSTHTHAHTPGVCFCSFTHSSLAPHLFLAGHTGRVCAHLLVTCVMKHTSSSTCSLESCCRMIYEHVIQH